MEESEHCEQVCLKMLNENCTSKKTKQPFKNILHEFFVLAAMKKTFKDYELLKTINILL